MTNSVGSTTGAMPQAIPAVAAVPAVPAPTSPTLVDAALADVVGTEVVGGGAAVGIEDPANGIPAFVQRFLDAFASGSMPSAGEGAAQCWASKEGAPSKQSSASERGQAQLGCRPTRPVTPSRPVEAGGRATTYRVKDGDYLSKIAPRFGLTWQQLYRANRDRISNPNIIFTGQVLRIPGSQASKPSAPSRPPVVETPIRPQRPATPARPTRPDVARPTPPPVPQTPGASRPPADVPSAPPPPVAPIVANEVPEPPPIPDTSGQLPPALP